MQLVRHYLYLSGAETASKVVTFVAIAYLARVLGPAGLGYVEFAGAVLLCAGLIVDQGFGPYGAREIARSPKQTRELVSEIVVVRAALAIVAYLALFIFAVSLDRPAVVTQLILVYGLSLLVAPLLVQWVFQGHNRMQTVAAIQVVRQAVFAAVVLAFVRSTAQIWVVGAAEIAGVSAASGYGVWSYFRQFGAPSRRPVLSARLFREGVPIGLSQIFWTLRMFGATALVGMIATPQDVGYFGAAMRILVAMHAFVWLYFFNLLPALSRSWQDADGSFSALTARSLRVVSWASVVGGLAWVGLAPLAMVWVYGPDFAPAGAALQWLAGVCVVAALSGHYRFGLIAAGLQDLEMAASAAGAVVALALIPVGYAYSGPSGAAASILVAELLVWGLTWRWARKKLRTNGHLSLLTRPCVGALIGGALLCLQWSESEIIRTGAAIVVVVGLALVLEHALRPSLRISSVKGQSRLDEQAREVLR